MKLEAYIQQEKQRTGASQNAIIERLVKMSGVSRATIYNILRGLKLKMYNKALALSMATGKKVKVLDIIE